MKRASGSATRVESGTTASAAARGSAWTARPSRGGYRKEKSRKEKEKKEEEEKKNSATPPA